MDWRDELGNLFAGYVNQQTLEEAAEMMAFVSVDDEECHRQFLDAIEQGIAAARRGDASTVGLINRSGYRVCALPEAIALLEEFRGTYAEAYGRAVRRVLPSDGS